MADLFVGRIIFEHVCAGTHWYKMVQDCPQASNCNLKKFSHKQIVPFSHETNLTETELSQNELC